MALLVADYKPKIKVIKRFMKTVKTAYIPLWCPV